MPRKPSPPAPQGLSRDQIEALIYGSGGAPRFTQDSPILPDVWIRYAEHPDRQQELLITPYQDARLGYTGPGELAASLKRLLRLDDARRPAGPATGRGGEPAQVAYNQATVFARLWFDELVRVVVPLSAWWHAMDGRKEMLASLQRPEGKQALVEALAAPLGPSTLPPDLVWLSRVIGTVELLRAHARGEVEAARAARLEPGSREHTEALVESLAKLVSGLDGGVWVGERPLVWSVSLNRKARATVFRSRATVKADAAARLFDITCRDLTWAVIDSGVDAKHVAFRARGPDGSRRPEPFEGKSNFTRVAATYDFTAVRELLSEETLDRTLQKLPHRGTWTPEDRQALRESLETGREVDWELFQRFLRVPHTKAGYRAPAQEHGTHVAGILAGDCRERLSDEPSDAQPVGLCADLQLYDLRVLDANGEGDEFNVMAALQFVRHLNAHQQATIVHGVNLSLAIRHDVANFACGRTPVCEECERLTGAGVVVVAAAGNDGYLQYLTTRGPQDNYRSISITDPGNAAGVITVGSTHRFQPHTYGVSYFSSRGPTGDGRAKPDLVAPGEKIDAPVGGEEAIRRMDGTSMAAPHVSGAAALLIARHRELAGQPARVKQILCATATDLGRERYFQGAGMVDVLRALQSV